MRYPVLMPLAVFLAVSSLVACEGVDWEQPNIVRSLRVIGVKAEPATLLPGQSTQLSILCADGGRSAIGAACDVDVAWFANCDNPSDNDAETCFAQYAKWLGAPGKALSTIAVGRNSGRWAQSREFVFTAPLNVLKDKAKISNHEVSFGTSYVFYAVCAGTLYSTAGSKDRLPVECRDRSTGRVLAQDRFVVGRTTVYSYDVVRNDNPQLRSLKFDGVPVSLKPCDDNTDCAGGLECHSEQVCAPVVAPCRSKRESACRPHSVALEVTKESFFPTTLDGASIGAAEKSVWVSYFTNAGSTPDEYTFGLSPSGERSGAPLALWRAPAENAEQARLWFVVRDDRGGQTWWTLPIIMRQP